MFYSITPITLQFTGVEWPINYLFTMGCRVLEFEEFVGKLGP